MYVSHLITKWNLYLTTETDPLFSQIYYVLRAWMTASGLYQPDNGGQSLRLSRKRIACFDGELLRELSWSILLNNENEVSCGDKSAKIAEYLLRHQACLQSSTKDGCSFYYDSKGPFARHWSDNQFRIVHEEFRILYAALNGEADQQFGERLTDDRLHETLQLLFSRHLLEKLLYQSYIRVTIQYSGQSQIAGTKMMQFVEERLLDLTHGKFCSGQIIYQCPSLISNCLELITLPKQQDICIR
jgi:hypothetical protein